MSSFGKVLKGSDDQHSLLTIEGVPADLCVRLACTPHITGTGAIHIIFPDLLVHSVPIDMEGISKHNPSKITAYR